MFEIKSAHNPRIKAAVKLKDRSGRQAQHRYLISGARELRLALQSKVSLAECFLCPDLCDRELAVTLRRRMEEIACPIFQVTPAVYDKVAYGQRRDGVVAVAHARALRLADLMLPECPLVAVLQGVEKPGNLGAVLRSADAAGVAAVVVADGATDLHNPNTIRASLGTVFAVPVACSDTLETLAWLREQRLRIYSARVEGAQDYAAVDFKQPCAVVLGGEAEGLSDDWRAADVVAVRLPMLGVADSLNVSVTAAVLFYEALRQRRGSMP